MPGRWPLLNMVGWCLLVETLESCHASRPCICGNGRDGGLHTGEVYVLNDGGETDLDLGNYERYLDISLNRDNNVTTGKVYQHVIDREVRLGVRASSLSKQRRGDYLGKTVQIIPHLTNAIQDWITRVSKVPVDETGEEPDVCIVEVGAL